MAPTQEGTYQLQAEFTEWGVVYKSNGVPFKVRTLHLNDYSWTQIQQIIASGQAPVTFAECFENGCCKEIPLSAGTTAIPYNSSGDTAISVQNIYVNILGFDHDEAADGETKPNATFGMAAAKKVVDKDGNIVNFAANQSTTDVNFSGGWIESRPGIMEEYSRMETTTGYANSKGYTVVTNFLDTVYSQCLPAELRNMIVPVVKKTSAGKKSPEIVTTTPHLFLFSEVELTGHWNMNADGSITEESNDQGYSNTQYGYLRSYEGEGSQYAYYSCVNDKADLRPLKYRLSRYYSWYERNPVAYTVSDFCYMGGTGHALYSYHNASYEQGVSFGFCVR